MTLTQFIICVLPLIAGFLTVIVTMRRSAKQVLKDLAEDEAREYSDHTATSIRGYTFGDPLAQAGLYEADERRQFQLISRVAPFIVASAVLAFALLAAKPATPACVGILLITLGLGFLISSSTLKRKIARYEMSLAFFLPVVMERVVMAVEAGLDVIPALKAVVEKKESESKRPDPVSRLLSIALRLSESGAGLERGLSEIGRKVDSRPLRHAFLHLAMAQKEGGELLLPLRELSDATQAYFQESIEERIAKLPARATLPLLCTFAGLIVCFLVPPLLQVLNIMQKSMPK